MQYSAITALLALLACSATTLALPEPLLYSPYTVPFDNPDSGKANRIYNQNPPKGQCRISSYISKIKHNVGWRVTTSDGTFISKGSCYNTPLCTSPLLGLGDDIAVAAINNEAWQYEFMRSGVVTEDRMLSTDTNRCTMNPPNPKGDSSVTVTCDFPCKQRWGALLGGNSKGNSNAEVARDLKLPDGLIAPTK